MMDCHAPIADPVWPLAGPRLTMRRLIVFVFIVALAGGGVAWYMSREPATATTTARPAPPAVPVLAGVAQAQDVQLYQTGLGTVQAFNTVTVRTRVDGEISRVAYRRRKSRPARMARSSPLLARVLVTT